jgi:hypothetical protein
MILFRPGPFAAELCRPVRVSTADARQFRKVTVRIGSVTTMLATAAVLYVNGDFAPLVRQPALLVWAALAHLALGLITSIFLRLATDMPVFLWVGLPSVRPHELSPIHHYACAPLALLPFLGLLAPLVQFTIRHSVPWEYALPIHALALPAVLVWLLLLWTTPLRMMSAATAAPGRRVALLAAYLPAHWLLMAVLTALGTIVAGIVVASGLEWLR